jgi:hypothetical protein
MVALHVSVPVRLLDLSSDGVRLACEVPLRAGSTVRVVSGLAGRRLEVELCVRHASSRRDERVGGYLVGGSFPPFDPTARHIIAALLGASAPLTAGERARWAGQDRAETPARGGVRRERPVRRPGHSRPDQTSWISPAP